MKTRGDNKPLTNVPDWTTLAGIGRPLPIFEMHKRGDSRVYLLQNTFLPPYKRPSAPGLELSPKEHRLLSQWKTAQTFLGHSVVLAQCSLPDQWEDIRGVDSVELPFPLRNLRKRFESWCKRGLASPCLVAALEVTTARSSRYYFSLDMTPLHPARRRIDLGKFRQILVSVAVAARLYNEATTQLFDIGIVIFHSSMGFEFGELYFAARGVPEWATLLDI